MPLSSWKLCICAHSPFWSYIFSFPEQVLLFSHSYLSAWTFFYRKCYLNMLNMHARPIFFSFPFTPYWWLGDTQKKRIINKQSAFQLAPYQLPVDLRAAVERAIIFAYVFVGPFNDWWVSFWIDILSGKKEKMKWNSKVLSLNEGKSWVFLYSRPLFVDSLIVTLFI